MTTPQDDVDRISKAQEGDRAAFGDLASRYRGRVEGWKYHRERQRKSPLELSPG